MSASAYLDQAVRWSKDLTRMRSRGPGDTENAMRVIEREYGVDYWTMWRLRYRRSAIRDIGVSVYMKLKGAYEAECQRQLQLLGRDIETIKAIADSSADLVDAAEALVREVRGG
ncbi:hypothetical protein [Bradyrhizobium sp. OK095]|uniref:hypothetical protein n=1 Tax=Bradyrhizobium sp. OK095 TaxID=1882760 RepID=UPI000B85DB38|nr:hypothetical protein [Bradyrhizobium sp. OK095]